MSVLIICAIILFLSLFVFFGQSPKLRRNGRPLRKPLDTLPFAGNVFRFFQNRQELFSWFASCERSFGFETFQISVPTLPPGVVINDPKNLDFVFRNEATFGKGDFFKSRSSDLFGHGIINADGELWKIQRKAGLQFLNNANLKVLEEVALPRDLHTIVRELYDMDVNKPVDLQAVLLSLTTKLMGRMAYDMDMSSENDFSQAFEYASSATGRRFQNPLWRVTEPIVVRKLKKSLAIVKSFGKEIVENAVEKRNKKDDKADGRLAGISGSLINALLDAIPDHQIVADAALNYLSAGRDTTTQGLTWAFYTLIRHPHVVSLIRREIEAEGAEEALTADPWAEDYESLRPNSLPYTTAVFYEVLRLYPPVPFEMKQCQTDTTLPDGTFLPKSSIVLWCPWAINRSKRIWGEDAESFRPERWLQDGKLLTKSQSEYPVFNGGARVCLGKKMAESIAVMVLAKLVLFFDFEDVEGGYRFSRNSLTLPMKGGLPVWAQARRRAADL
ncbi:hypothetical protein V495_07167 [Pseudogymnoascus sp. VKM F-4514 (FW-929)]|nr:hypothetical protein V495_07167 [Pseudogymnoascus sp. VKM F-4514 (FW-929)]KFY59580.1 hypothetical protein V497_04210 [Pseudogymnoascus sp. VKM F-4516 (FW-969)]